MLLANNPQKNPEGCITENTKESKLKSLMYSIIFGIERFERIAILKGFGIENRDLGTAEIPGTLIRT